MKMSFLLYLILFLAISGCKNDNTLKNAAGNVKQSSVSDSMPKMHIPVLFKDFAEVKRGDTLKTRFQIVNRGLKTLNISNYEANCPCIHLNLATTQIEPGDSSSLDVIYLTDTKMGYDEKEISISGNGIPQKSILRVMCIVKSQKQH